VPESGRPADRADVYALATADLDHPLWNQQAAMWPAASPSGPPVPVCGVAGPCARCAPVAPTGDGCAAAGCATACVHRAAVRERLWSLVAAWCCRGQRGVAAWLNRQVAAGWAWPVAAAWLGPAAATGS